MRSKLYKEPRLKEPLMVVGLPGTAYVAKLSTDYLIKELEAQLFEELYPPSFPPYVLVGDDGIVELLRNELYYWKRADSGGDLIIFTGNAKAITPEGQHEVAEEILKKAEGFNVERMYMIATYLVEQRVENPRVYVAATSQELLEELEGLGASIMEEGNIDGINGLVLGLAKARGIPGICLLGETQTYTTPSGRMVTDPRAAKAILEVLTKALKIEIDMTDIESQARYTWEFIQKIQEIEQHAIEEAFRKTVSRPRPSYIY